MPKKIYTFFLVLFIPIFTSAQLVITEIMYNPPESGIDSLEFIELYNPSDLAVDLDGYTFSAGVMHEFSSVIIDAQGYIVVSVDSAAMRNVFNMSTIQWTEGALNNGGELIAINDPQGNLLDQVEYSPGGSWPAKADGGGSSLELCDPGSDNSDPDNWQASEFGTGVMINGLEVLASPGSENCQVDADVVVEVKNNVFDPADITIYEGETVRWEAIEGTHNVNGSLDAYPDNPEGFMSGPATLAPWIYSHTFEEAGLYNYHCDPHLSLGMTGTITVQSLSELYPLYDIADVKGIDANGIADSLDVKCTLEGIVHSINFHPDGYSFALIDETGAGITIFSTAPVSDYEVSMGDELRIRGFIDQFNGLIELRPEDIMILSTGNALLNPQVVMDALGEAQESHFIQIKDLTLDDPSQWEGDGGNFNVDVSNQNADYVIRVDADSEVSNMPPPQGAFHVTGICSQYDNSEPYLEGYQIFPRIMEDIEEASAVGHPDVPEVEVFPNPATEYIRLLTGDKKVSEYRIFTIDGQLLKKGSLNNGRRVDIRTLPSGAYMMLLNLDGSLYRATFVRQ